MNHLLNGWVIKCPVSAHNILGDLETSEEFAAKRVAEIVGAVMSCKQNTEELGLFCCFFFPIAQGENERGNYPQIPGQHFLSEQSSHSNNCGHQEI